jgi:hypothetical protein
MLCGKNSELYICSDCVRAKNDPRTVQIWDKNKKLATSLGGVYFESVLKSYGGMAKKESKENLGFNCFCEGINCGLDLAMPFLDDAGLDNVKKKISELIETRKKMSALGR